MQKIYKITFFIIFLIGTIKADGHENTGINFLNEGIHGNSIIFNSQLSLKQQLGFTNYPNPITTQTTISYLLPSKSNVVLKVVDLAGKQLFILLQQEQSAGRQEYNWELSKNKITAGMYILVLQVNKLSYTKKIIVQ